MDAVAQGAVDSIDSLVGLLGRLLIGEARLLTGVRREVQFIKDEMDAMNAFLLSMSRPEDDGGNRHPLQRVWLIQVRDVAAQSELYINSYTSCLDVGDHGACCGQLGRTARSMASIRERHLLATKIRDLKERVREVADRRKRYEPLPPLPTTNNYTNPSTASSPSSILVSNSEWEEEEPGEDQYLESRRMLAEDDSDMFVEAVQEIIHFMSEDSHAGHHSAGPSKEAAGAELMFEQHTELNKEEDDDDEDVQGRHLKVISILGVHGTGKTTLARKVHHAYGSLPNRKAFWISLGEDQSRKKVLESILSTIAPDIPGIDNICNWEEGSIVEMLIGRFRNNKFLLVILDDVSSESLKRDLDDVFMTCDCSVGSAILLVTSIPQVGKSCNLLDYTFDFNNLPKHHTTSLVDFFLERAVSLVDHKPIANSPDLPDVLRDIFTDCSPSIFTMKMFLRSLFVNPNRNIEELRKLRNSLHLSSGLLNSDKMLNFCYHSLPSNYRNCLVYLAISPRDHTFRRTSLARRWHAEHLINRSNMTSDSDQDVANRCFDYLCAHNFLLPAGDVTGTSNRGSRLKRCSVHGIVLNFLSTILEDEGAVDKKLFPNMAMRISIQNGLLQATRDHPLDQQQMNNLVESLVTHPGLKQINVLDLEGCRGFQDGHVRVLCRKALCHLKYLSLRNTGISRLPKQMEHLNHLETLDIRQTNVSALDITLPMLKYLQAGKSGAPGESFSTIQIPRRITSTSMTNIEVLSHVNVSNEDSGLIIYLGRLRLRKLGVVFSRERSGLIKSLFRQIEMMQDYLRSLSIRIELEDGSSSSSEYSLVDSYMLSPPRFLQTLNISGTRGGLPLWVTRLRQLAKITLHKTFLTQEALHLLGAVHSLQFLRFLRRGLTNEGSIIFRSSDFKELVDLLFEQDSIKLIIFETGTAPKLERVVFKGMEVGSVNGIKRLTNLKELEFTGDLHERAEMEQEITEHPNHPRYNYQHFNK